MGKVLFTLLQFLVGLYLMGNIGRRTTISQECAVVGEDRSAIIILVNDAAVVQRLTN
jgi:hypothetical protein